MKVEVECYSGYRGEETPRRVILGSRTIDIAEVLDQWLAPGHRYFKVRGSDDATYILRHDPAGGTWQLVMFEGSRSPS